MCVSVKKQNEKRTCPKERLFFLLFFSVDFFFLHEKMKVMEMKSEGTKKINGALFACALVSFKNGGKGL